MKTTLQNSIRCLGILFILIYSSFQSYGQRDMDINKVTAQDFIQNILGKGIDVTNIKYNGAPIANKQEVGVGVFTDKTGGFEINEGVVLSTINLDSVHKVPLFKSFYGNSTSSLIYNLDKGMNSTYQDPDLLKITGNNYKLNDISVIEFDFIPTGDSLKFEYIFGSQEYPNFVCSQYNDIFGFFITGTNIDGNPTNRTVNIAKIPNTNIPVSITTVNNGVIGSSAIPFEPNPLYLSGDIAGSRKPGNQDGSDDTLNINDQRKRILNYDFNKDGKTDQLDRQFKLTRNPLQTKKFIGRATEFYEDLGPTNSNGYPDQYITKAHDQQNGRYVPLFQVSDYDINNDNKLDLLDFYVDQDGNGKIDRDDYTLTECSTGLGNSQYYIENYTDLENDLKGKYDFFLNGYTTRLLAKASVECGGKYHMKLAIADVNDGQRSSAVFFEKNSFRSNAGPKVNALSLSTEGTKLISESCGEALYLFTRPSLDFEPTIQTYVDETEAKNGIDYGVLDINNILQKLPTNIIFHPDSLNFRLRIVAKYDQEKEQNEKIIFGLSYTDLCLKNQNVQDTITIVDVTPAEVSFTPPTIDACSKAENLIVPVEAVIKNQPFYNEWQIYDVTGGARVLLVNPAYRDTTGRSITDTITRTSYDFKKSYRKKGDYRIVLTYTDSICMITKKDSVTFPLQFTDALAVTAEDVVDVVGCSNKDIPLNGKTSVQTFNLTNKEVKLQWIFGDGSISTPSYDINDQDTKHRYPVTNQEETYNGKFIVTILPDHPNYGDYCIYADTSEFSVTIKAKVEPFTLDLDVENPPCFTGNTVDIPLVKNISQPLDISIRYKNGRDILPKTRFRNEINTVLTLDVNPLLATQDQEIQITYIDTICQYDIPPILETITITKGEELSIGTITINNQSGCKNAPVKIDENKFSFNLTYPNDSAFMDVSVHWDTTNIDGVDNIVSYENGNFEYPENLYKQDNITYYGKLVVKVNPDATAQQQEQAAKYCIKEKTETFDVVIPKEPTIPELQDINVTLAPCSIENEITQDITFPLQKEGEPQQSFNITVYKGDVTDNDIIINNKTFTGQFILNDHTFNSDEESKLIFTYQDLICKYTPETKEINLTIAKGKEFHLPLLDVKNEDICPEDTIFNYSHSINDQPDTLPSFIKSAWIYDIEENAKNIEDIKGTNKMLGEHDYNISQKNTEQVIEGKIRLYIDREMVLDAQTEKERDSYCKTDTTATFFINIKKKEEFDPEFVMPKIPQCTDFDSLELILSLAKSPTTVVWELVDSVETTDVVYRNDQNLNQVKLKLPVDKTFLLRLKAHNECVTEFKDIDYIHVGGPVHLDNLIIPNVFTPNGDGKNDEFKFGYANQSQIENAEELLQYEYKIFNRWGKVIFEGGKNRPWDGTVRGSEAESAIYYYIIDFKAQCVKNATKEGTWDGYINLLRD